MQTATSPSFPHGARCDRTEAEVRAIRAGLSAATRTPVLSQPFPVAHPIEPWPKAIANTAGWLIFMAAVVLGAPHLPALLAALRAGLGK